MGLKKNDTIKILLLGIGAICILLIGIIFKAWHFYSRKMIIKAMYIRRIGCFTTPPHGDPEAGEVAWSVAGARLGWYITAWLSLVVCFRFSMVLCSTSRRVLGKGSTLSLGVSLGLSLVGVSVVYFLLDVCMLPRFPFFRRLLENRTVFVLYSCFTSAYWRRSGLMNFVFNFLLEQISSLWSSMFGLSQSTSSTLCLSKFMTFDITQWSIFVRYFRGGPLIYIQSISFHPASPTPPPWTRLTP